MFIYRTKSEIIKKALMKETEGKNGNQNRSQGRREKSKYKI
jgi:hypothetical protein